MKFAGQSYELVLYAVFTSSFSGVAVGSSTARADQHIDQRRQLSQLVAGSSIALVSAVLPLLPAFCAYLLQIAMKQTGLLQKVDRWVGKPLAGPRPAVSGQKDQRNVRRRFTPNERDRP